MTKSKVTLQRVETRLSGLVDTVEEYLNSHRELKLIATQAPSAETPKTIGIVDYEDLEAVTNLLEHGLTETLNVPPTTRSIQSLVHVLFEEEVYIQRLEYNPGSVITDNQFSNTSLALTSGRTTSFLALLTASPFLQKQTAKVIYENIDKNSEDFSINFLTLLGEISNNILSSVDAITGKAIDRMFERHEEFLTSSLLNQVIDVSFRGALMTVDILGDYRTVVLNSFVRSIYYNREEDTNVDDIKSLISNTVNNCNIGLMENYVKHFIAKKK